MLKITSPQPGATFVEGARIEADVEADKGTKAVGTFVNGVQVGARDTSKPYTRVLPPLLPGDYVLTAIAWDASGKKLQQAAPVMISVTAVLVPVPVPVDEVVSPWTFSTATDWSACQADNTQTRTETWVKTTITPASNGGTAYSGPRSETRTGTQTCVYVPPVEQPPTPGESLDGTRGLTVTDGDLNVYTFAPTGGAFDPPGSRTVLCNGEPLTSSTAGLEFLYRVKTVFLWTAWGYWFALTPAGPSASAVADPYAIGLPGPTPDPSPNPNPAPTPDPSQPGQPEPPLVFKPVYSGDGSAPVFNPETDLVFEKAFELDNLVTEFQQLSGANGWTCRVVDGEPRALVSFGGGFEGPPDLLEFSLAGLVAGGAHNKLRMTNAWKGADLFAGIGAPSAGTQGWDTFSMDADGVTVYHVATGFLGGASPAYLSSRKLGPNGTVTDVKVVWLEGESSTCLYGGVRRLPPWFTDRYHTGPLLAGFGGGLRETTAPQSLGLYAVTVPDLAAVAMGTVILAAQVKRVADHTSGFVTPDRWSPPHSPSTPGPFDRGMRRPGVHRNFAEGGDAFDPTHGGPGWVDVVGTEIRASRTWTPGVDPSTFIDGLRFNEIAAPSVIGSGLHTIQLTADAADTDAYYGGSLATYVMVHAGAGAWHSYRVVGYDQVTKQLQTEEPIAAPLDATSKVAIGWFADPPLFNLDVGEDFWTGATFVIDGMPKFVHPFAYILMKGGLERVQVQSRDAVHHMTIKAPLAAGDQVGAIFMPPHIDPLVSGILRADGMQWTDAKDPLKGSPDGIARLAHGDNFWSTGQVIDSATKQGLLVVGDFAKGATFKSNFHVCSSDVTAELQVFDLRHLGETAQGVRTGYDVQPTHMMELQPVSADIQAAVAAQAVPNWPPPLVYARGTFPRSATVHSTLLFPSFQKFFAVVGFGNTTRLYQYAMKLGVPTTSPDGAMVEKAEDGTWKTPQTSLTDADGNNWSLSDTQVRVGPNSALIGYQVTVNGGPMTAVRPRGFPEDSANVLMKVGGTVYTKNRALGCYGPDGSVIDPSHPEWLPPVVAPAVGNRKVIGGYRLPKDLWGTMAINFDTMQMRVSSAYQFPRPVAAINLPSMGVGADPSKWPLVTVDRMIDAWWPDALLAEHLDPSEAYCGGLVYWHGKYWAAPKRFYDPAPPPFLQLVADDGEVRRIELGRQAFAGIVKRGPNLDFLLGGGGDESGTGGVRGPSLATLDGQALTHYGRPFDLGVIDPVTNKPSNWDLCAPRPANFVPAWGDDSWIAFNPRVINGTLQAVWAADRIYGGGLVLPEGISYWARLALGCVDYGTQIPTFARENCRRTYRYLLDRTTYAFDRYELTGLGQVNGQELDADGRVYLTHGPMDADGRGFTSLYLSVFA